jgi:hypothetical protein
LKRLPESVRQEIVRELDRAGREILPVMQSRAPVRTGATRAGLSYRVLRGSLRLLVGLISTPLGRAKLFYARIQDLGRKRAGGHRAPAFEFSAGHVVRQRRPASLEFRQEVETQPEADRAGRSL